MQNYLKEKRCLRAREFNESNFIPKFCWVLHEFMMCEKNNNMYFCLMIHVLPRSSSVFIQTKKIYS